MNADKKMVHSIDKLLHELWNQTKELAGSEESMELINDLSVFLLRLFLNMKNVQVKHIAEMKKSFGDVTMKQANRVHQV